MCFFHCIFTGRYGKVSCNLKSRSQNTYTKLPNCSKAIDSPYSLVFRTTIILNFLKTNKSLTLLALEPPSDLPMIEKKRKIILLNCASHV